MNETEKRLSFWSRAARSDLDTAGLLIQESKLLHGLLFCHLAIEKALFAHILKLSKELPAGLVSLTRLLTLGNIRLGEKDTELLEDLTNYMEEVRFPVNNDNHLTERKVIDYLNRTRELYLWLERTL